MKYKSNINGIFILLFILLMLTSCKQAEQIEKEQSTSDTELVYSFENPETNQKFKIIHTNSLFDQYIEKVKDTPRNLKSDIYKKVVIQPVYEDCFENAEFIYMADNILNNAPFSVTELKIVNELMETRKEEINALIQESLLKSIQQLTSEKDIAVCVFPSTNSNVSMFAVGAGKIIIPFNEYFEDDFIKVGIAHEYHHSTWAEKYVNTHSGSVLDNLIFEGKAVMFEKMVYPELESTPVDYTYNKELWSEIENDLDKKNLNRSLEILVGGNDLPLLYGYSEGYKMIKSYLDLHPNLSPEEWTAIGTEEIIKQGKYLDHYK